LCVAPKDVASHQKKVTCFTVFFNLAIYHFKLLVSPPPLKHYLVIVIIVVMINISLSVDLSVLSYVGSQAVQEFTSALSKGDQAVFTLTAYALQGGLEKMKQKAMNYAFDEADVAAMDAPSLSADISGLVAARQDSESSKGRSPRSSRK
jgi:hypothetical protein